MGIQKLVSTPEQAYRNIRTRLIQDLGPVWELINSREYSPFWLLTRELFPIAESIGDLIYKFSSTAENLAKVINNDLSKIREIYRGKGEVISLLYRHSLIHQDEPRSIYSGNITIEWELAYIDGRHHLQTLNKDTRRRKCVMSFDLRAFYEDILKLLELYEKTGPRQGIVRRYNSWTFRKFDSLAVKKSVKDFYDQI